MLRISIRFCVEVYKIAIEMLPSFKKGMFDDEHAIKNSSAFIGTWGSRKGDVVCQKAHRSSANRERVRTLLRQILSKGLRM